jgi:hypothetical protein
MYNYDTGGAESPLTLFPSSSRMKDLGQATNSALSSFHSTANAPRDTATAAKHDFAHTTAVDSLSESRQTLKPSSLLMTALIRK